MMRAHLCHHGEVDDEAQQTADQHRDLSLVTMVVLPRKQIQDSSYETLDPDKLTHTHTHTHTDKTNYTICMILHFSLIVRRNIELILAHLTVQAEQQQHEEEERRPQRSHRHQTHRLRIRNEGQTWT